MPVRIIHGDMLSALVDLPPDSIDSCVTDPPYHLTTGKKGGTGKASVNPNSPAGRSMISTGFMGKRWDGGDVAFRPETWAAVLRVLKPGAHLLAFGGTRTYHRMVCAIEDAGFEIRDQIAWLYGTGFPKSLDVSKALDKAGGVEREDKFEGALARRAGPTGNKKCDLCGKWLVSGSPCQCPRPQDAPITTEAKQWNGWGTALKPAIEPIVVARKPLVGTVAENVLQHGTGALNIGGCRVPTDDDLNGGAYAQNGNRSISSALHAGSGMNQAGKTAERPFEQPLGRWPANIVHDGSDEVLAAFPEADGRKKSILRRGITTGSGLGYGSTAATQQVEIGYSEYGSAARFFYSAKANASDRLGSKHPTVKPLDLIRWLVRLVTPPGGTVLDPFAGTGTTGIAAREEGFNAIPIEREAEYVEDIRRRLNHASGGDTPLFTLPLPTGRETE